LTTCYEQSAYCMVACASAYRFKMLHVGVLRLRVTPEPPAPDANGIAPYAKRQVAI
jgi:hypothetical protein